MDKLRRNILMSVALVMLLYGIGLVVYHNLEGWSFVDSIYFQTATFTTVGYGDITPKTDAGKIFTVFLIWIGISIGFYVLYTIASYREQVVDKKIGGAIDRVSHALKNKKTNWRDRRTNGSH